jgi:hypothetical protein
MRGAAILRGAAALLAMVAVVATSATRVWALGDANTASCSNEREAGFRPYLPDCRAYEMVTPPYKGGGFVAIDQATLTAEGSEVLGESIAHFAEEAPKVIGDPFNPYRFDRTNAGWTTSPLLTPAGEALLERPGKVLDRVLYRHRDEASGRTLWSVLYRSGEAGDLEAVFYVEQPDGSFSELGPATPGPFAPHATPTSSGPAEYAVSSGIARVVFGNTNSGLTPGEHWPGDTTLIGAESLYEYTASDGPEPRLVGVENQHKLTSNGEAELISDCGTFLGASFGKKRFALANSGNMVVFTAAEGREGECSGPAVTEIYARIAGEHTVALSEPSHEDCEDCNTSSGLVAAVFQGASSDGTKIYFSTSQELLPAAKGNNLYVYDFAGAVGHKVSLVSSGASESGVQGLVRISEDGSHVYFVATGALTGENAEHKTPTSGLDNLYLYERDAHYPTGRLAFVATLASSDENDWEAGDFSRPAAVTPTGADLVFVSSADLTSDDTSTQRQLFEYDARTETLARVSVGQRDAEHPGGFNEDGNTANEIDQVSIALPDYARNSSAAGETTRTMSDQGNAVFFQTPLALTPEAGDNINAGRACSFGVETEAGECLFGEHQIYVQNVYEFRWSGRATNGNVYLISGGRDASAFHEGEAVELLGTDPSGADALFTTSESLLPQDTDTQIDVYDARVEGGFPALSSPTSCGDGPCEGQPTAPPNSPAPGSATWPAGENLPAGVAGPRTTKPLTRAAQRARALKLCHKQPRRRRRRCEASARRRFSSSAHAESSRRGK